MKSSTRCQSSIIRKRRAVCAGMTPLSALNGREQWKSFPIGTRLIPILPDL